MSKNQEVFVHNPPSKLESRLGLLNLRSPDAGGSGWAKSTSPMVGGDVLAALNFGVTVKLEAAKYIDHRQCMDMMALLVYRKYQCDLQAGRDLMHWVRIVFVAQLIQETKDQRALNAEIAANRGTLTACCEVVIEDVCDPHIYSDLTSRAWARKVGLKDHRAWQGRWARRYAELRRVLADLDTVAVEKIEKFT